MNATTTSLTVSDEERHRPLPRPIRHHLEFLTVPHHLEEPVVGLTGPTPCPRSFTGGRGRGGGPQIQGSEFRPGARVSLLFEEDNPFDPNAISVWSADRRRQTGYIPKDEAPRLRNKFQQDDHYAFVV